MHTPTRYTVIPKIHRVNGPRLYPNCSFRKAARGLVPDSGSSSCACKHRESRDFGAYSSRVTTRQTIVAMPTILANNHERAESSTGDDSYALVRVYVTSIPSSNTCRISADRWNRCKLSASARRAKINRKRRTVSQHGARNRPRGPWKTTFTFEVNAATFHHVRNR